MDIPTQIVQELIEKQPQIEEFIANLEQQGSSPLNIGGIPVRFTAITGPSGGFSLSQANVNFALNALNQAFSPMGVNFIQCGEINEIWDDRIKSSEEVDQFITSFAYASGTLEVFVKSSTPPPYAPIPEQAYQSGNPNWPTGAFQHTNFVKLNGPADLGPTLVHETGHHFGLLHTHFVSSTNYSSPPVSDANDHPYPVLDANNQIIPTWWGRELVIRQNLSPNSPKPFKTVNFLSSGDLVEDTPADCANIPSFFPGCPITAQNVGCDFNNTLTYTDYNGDGVNPPPAGYSLGRNYMSYWRINCLNQFTTKQLQRAKFYYDTEREPHYALPRCGTFTDRVEFEGTNLGLHNVSIRVRHSNDQKCNVTSSKLGNFSGLLHQDVFNTHIYHNGKKNTLEFATNPLKIHYGHTRCEWIKGVNVGDLLFIRDHILGNIPLSNGYRIIAADANKSNSVTTFDIVELRKLILGVYWDFLPNQEQPFRYIPEVIPQTMGNQFNIQPFTLLNGAYLEQGWTFSIPPDGQRGFDGIKIGDVNSTWPTDNAPCQDEPEQVGTPSVVLAVPTINLAQNDIVGLTIKSQQSLALAGFQLGLTIPSEKLEVLDIITGAMTDYNKTEHFGIGLQDSNALTTAWISPTGFLNIPAGGTFFTVVVKAKSVIPNLQNVVSLSSDVLSPLFIQGGNSLVSIPASLNMEATPISGNRDASDAN
ncbi:MAG: hypothetical protein IT261_00585, partial [Saprospiraceae bacterium]|nr:hypothetical protein [Saprospiraceae bacterium]